MAIPSSFQQPASGLLCPLGPSPNHRLAVSPREVQTAAVWQDHPCPTLWSYFHHKYIQMDKQICFSQLWVPDWKPEAAMWTDAHTL